MAVMNFQQALPFGKLGETQIANWIKAQGYHVVPVYEKQDNDYKGPTLYAAEGDTLILPDLLALQPGSNGGIRLVWCEAKNKSTFTMHQKTRRWLTGIDRHLFEQYLEVQRRTGINVHLLFLQNGGADKDTGEQSPQGLYGNRIAYLAEHIHHDWKYKDVLGRDVWMVYWAIEDLKFIASMDAVKKAQP